MLFITTSCFTNHKDIGRPSLLSFHTSSPYLLPGGYSHINLGNYILNLTDKEKVLVAIVSHTIKALAFGYIVRTGDSSPYEICCIDPSNFEVMADLINHEDKWEDWGKELSSKILNNPCTLDEGDIDSVKDLLSKNVYDDLNIDDDEADKFVEVCEPLQYKTTVAKLSLGDEDPFNGAGQN